MERYKIFTGIVAWMNGVVDGVMDAINRNFQKFGGFFTSTYGINMQDGLDALEVYDPGGPGPITVRAGEAISPLYNVIINDAAESIQTLIDYLFDPPVNDDICYVFVTTKEDYDPTSDATLNFFPSYSVPADPYYKWNISHEFKVQDNDFSLPDTNAILLAKMTYVSATSSWTIEDKRIQTQFSISFGNTELIYHLLSAHTACLYPDGTDALTPSRSGNSIEVVQLQTTYNDYLYSEGQIYREILSISISFSGSDDDGWYYIYVDDGDLAKIKVADEYASFPYSTKDYFVIAFVHWTDPNLNDPTDERTAYFLPTNAIDVRNVPANTITSKNVQDAINELETLKLAKAGDTMSGDLNMSLNKITNIGNNTSFGNSGNPVLLKLEKSGDSLNMFNIMQFFGAPGADLRIELFDKLKLQSGAEIDASVEDLKVTGGNIQLDTTKTVDGRDVSLLKVGFEWVVNRNTGSTPDSSGAYGLDYVLSNVAQGDTVFIKKGSYTIGQSYLNLPSGITIIGESIVSTLITLGSYEIELEIYSRLTNISIDIDTGKLDIQGCECIVDNCRIDGGTMEINGPRCSISNIVPIDDGHTSLDIYGYRNCVSNSHFSAITLQASADECLLSNIVCSGISIYSDGCKFSNIHGYGSTITTQNGADYNHFCNCYIATFNFYGGAGNGPNIYIGCRGDQGAGAGNYEHSVCINSAGNLWT